MAGVRIGSRWASAAIIVRSPQSDPKGFRPRRLLRTATQQYVLLSGMGAMYARDARLSSPTDHSSVVVSKFAKFTDIGLSRELRNQNDTRFNGVLVSFDSEIRPKPDIEIVRI